MTEEFMFTTFTLFLAGIITVPLSLRLGLGSVLGYLIAGIAIGPILHWSQVDIVSLQHFTEFGVVMMLFLIGLETRPKVLWNMRSRIFIMGGLQVLITAIIVMIVALLFDLSWRMSLVIGLTFALSSTAIVNQTLVEKGLLRSDGGQASFSVLLFQDIAVIPMLAFFPLLAMPDFLSKNKSASDTANHINSGMQVNLVEDLSAGMTVLVTLATIGFIILAGHYLTGPIFQYISKARLRELFVSTALMIVVGITLAMLAVGLSPALGTFIAGVVMGNSEYRHELESNISPFKGIFLGVFFMTVGANIDFVFLIDNFVLIIGSTLLLIIVKILVLLGIAHYFKLKGSEKWLLGLCLSQAGEFGFVLLSFSVSHSIIPTEIADILLLIVTLSMFMSPLLFIIYNKVIAPRYSQEKTQESGHDIPSDSKIILAGFGRFGGVVNRALTAAGYQTTIVDYSSEQLRLLRRFGLHAYFGDATRPDLLHAAGIEQAKVLVIAIDNKQAITDLARYVCKHHPHIHIVARAIDRWHVYDLWAVGCRDIIRETYDSSIRASRSVFEALGLPRKKAEALTKIFESFDRKSMSELADIYNADDPYTDKSAFSSYIRENREHKEKELQAQMKKALAAIKIDDNADKKKSK